MVVEKVHKGIRYTLSNDGLKTGDSVFPIARGRATDKGWILSDFRYEDYSTGFPEMPHTIVELYHSKYRPYEVKTNYGFGVKEMYYKVVKKEHQVEYQSGIFKSYKWEIIN